MFELVHVSNHGDFHWHRGQLLWPCFQSNWCTKHLSYLSSWNKTIEHGDNILNILKHLEFNRQPVEPWIKIKPLGTLNLLCVVQHWTLWMGWDPINVATTLRTHHELAIFLFQRSAKWTPPSPIHFPKNSGFRTFLRDLAGSIWGPAKTGKLPPWTGLLGHGDHTKGAEYWKYLSEQPLGWINCNFKTWKKICCF
jgi:hypothetical protein